MSPTDKIDNLIKQLKTTASGELDRRIDALIGQSAKQPHRPMNIWSKIMKSKAAQGAIAAMVIIGAFFGIYQITGSIDGAAPAFADVVNNVMAQKWVYMFEEDRNDGTINFEYWYNPREQKVFAKSNTESGPESGIVMIDLVAGETTAFKNGTIKIDRAEFGDYYEWLSERLPMIGGSFEDYQKKGAVITQTAALYNNKPAYSYEIELSLPEGKWGNGERFRTYQYTWIVDKTNNLPIICEYNYFDLVIKDNGEKEPKNNIESGRYAFDYIDSGPADIYALGVPENTEIEDDRPTSEIQALIDKINTIKAEQYQSYAAIQIDNREYPNEFIIRDGVNSRRDNFQLSINGSAFTSNKEQYLNDMGDTFESIYRWINKHDNVLFRGYEINNQYFEYMTHDREIEEDKPVSTSLRYYGYNDFLLRYCWWFMPEGEIVEDEYSKEKSLICCKKPSGNKSYYDPAHNYFRVASTDIDGNIAYEISEFAKTPNGMLYPKEVREPYYREDEKKTGTYYLAGYNTYHIYAVDLNAELKSLLDPQSLPNYVDHTQLTLDLIEQRESAAGPETPAIQEYTGFTPLHMAIYRQDVNRVKKYLNEGVDVEPDTDTGTTPMELAVAAGNLELIKLLHEHGADFYSNDKQHRCCLGLAAENGFTDVVDLMMELGADINAVYIEGNTPLHYAASNGNALMVHTLLEYNPEIDAFNQSGYTPLAESVREYSRKIQSLSPEHIQEYQNAIRLLVDSGADINQPRDRQGDSRMTILHYVIHQYAYFKRAVQKEIDLIRFLFDLGADPNLMTRNESPLYTAVSKNCYDLTKILLDNGADPWKGPLYCIDFPYNNLLRSTKDSRPEAYDLLYPYMEERYLFINTGLKDTAKALIQAILSDDSEALESIYLKGPHSYSDFLPEWAQQIRDFYTGHEGLLDNIIPGWFTINGFAEVYVPLPEGSKYKSMMLGFFLHPDGTWKWMWYSQQRDLPEFQEIRQSWFLSSEPMDFRGQANFIYDQYGATDKIWIQGGALTRDITNKDIKEKVVVSIQDGSLRFAVNNKCWCLLTTQYVKEYWHSELEIYDQINLRQKDRKIQMTLEALKCTITSPEKTYIFTLENGKILFNDGTQTVAAEKFTVNMPEVEMNK